MCGSYYIFSDTDLDGKTHLGSSILNSASIGFTLTIYYSSIESNHNPIPFLLLSHVIISQLFPQNICFEAELHWAEHRDRGSREQLSQYRKKVWVLQAPKLTMGKGGSNNGKGGSGEDGSLEDYVSFPENVNISAYFHPSRELWYRYCVSLNHLTKYSLCSRSELVVKVKKSCPWKKMNHRVLFRSSLHFQECHPKRKTFLTADSLWLTVWLVCCGPWGRQESDTTEQLSNNNRTWRTTLTCLRDLGLNVGWGGKTR